jgi:hypothetical protein
MSFGMRTPTESSPSEIQGVASADVGGTSRAFAGAARQRPDEARVAQRAPSERDSKRNRAEVPQVLADNLSPEAKAPEREEQPAAKTTLQKVGTWLGGAWNAFCEPHPRLFSEDDYVAASALQRGKPLRLGFEPSPRSEERASFEATIKELEEQIVGLEKQLAAKTTEAATAAARIQDLKEELAAKTITELHLRIQVLEGKLSAKTAEAATPSAEHGTGEPMADGLDATVTVTNNTKTYDDASAT